MRLALVALQRLVAYRRLLAVASKRACRSRGQRLSAPQPMRTAHRDVVAWLIVWPHGLQVHVVLWDFVAIAAR